MGFRTQGRLQANSIAFEVTVPNCFQDDKSRLRLREMLTRRISGVFVLTRVSALSG